MRDALTMVDDVDLLVSDLALPDGNGHELMRKLAAQRPLPAIALSGYETADDARRSADAGFARHMVKPVEPSELLAAVGELCERETPAATS